MGGSPDLAAGDIADILGHEFTDPDLLVLALTHPSATGCGPAGSNGDDAKLYNYERLEFLGDRVLGLVIADLLLRRYPKEREGKLARRHTQLVRKEALAQVAEEIGLGGHLALSRSEEGAGGRNNPAILADCCEAVIAALYLDGGISVAERFILEHWVPIMEATVEPAKDPKTALQEWAQARGLPLPSYDVVEHAGPDHQPVFAIKVTIAGQPSLTGTGKSKQSAEKAAASQMLQAIAGKDEA